MTRSREEARASYDRLSRWYDLLIGPFERGCREAGLCALAPREGELILEIGFGTGHGVVALAHAAGSGGRVCGIDLSPRMCQVARTRLRAAGLADRAAMLCGDAVCLPFAAGRFDAISMSFTLELFDTPEIPRVLQQCRRVLRIGGRLCVVAMARPGRPRLTVRLYEWLHRRFPRYLDCRPIAVRQLLVHSGFEVLGEAELSMGGLPVAIVLVENSARQ